uniref:Uncharacterized protein n=1 Tax=Sus scrofa TaxID=9823 RepID=A0A8D0XFD1_PIG
LLPTLRESQVHTSPLDSGGCWQTLSFPGLERHNYIVCFHLLCVSVSSFLLLIRILISGFRIHTKSGIISSHCS